MHGPDRREMLVYAHRGASLERPENTLEAFELGLAQGADAIETDAHVTRDGRVVLCHDPRGDRTAGVSRAVADLTLAEVREWDVGATFVDREGGAPFQGRRFRMPTLEEALTAFPGVFFNVDAKPTAPHAVAAIVRAIRAVSASERVRIASFSGANIRRAAALGYEGPLGVALAGTLWTRFAPTVVARHFALVGDAVQVPVRERGITFGERAAIARFHALGLRVDFWTIDDPAEAVRLRRLGANGIVTNRPREIVRALR